MFPSRYCHQTLETLAKRALSGAGDPGASVMRQMVLVLPKPLIAFARKGVTSVFPKASRREAAGVSTLDCRARQHIQGMCESISVGCLRLFALSWSGEAFARIAVATVLSPTYLRWVMTWSAFPCSARKSSCPVFTSSDQANRRISTGQLSALLRLHLRPIDVVVYHDPWARPCFEGGFPLRCLQRLSCPFIATLHCGWRHNRSTSGTSTPVLSY